MTTWPTCYVAGPISGGDRAENIRRGIEAGLWLMERGVSPFIPHLNAREEFPSAEPGTKAYEDVVQADFAFVARCDAVLRLSGRSGGADRETALARSLGVPVFTDRDRCLHYLRGLQALRGYTAQWGHGDGPAPRRETAGRRQAPGGAPGNERGPREQEAVAAAAGRPDDAGAGERAGASVQGVPPRGIRHLARVRAARRPGRG